MDIVYKYMFIIGRVFVDCQRRQACQRAREDKEVAWRAKAAHRRKGRPRGEEDERDEGGGQKGARRVVQESTGAVGENHRE